MPEIQTGSTHLRNFNKKKNLTQGIFSNLPKQNCINAFDWFDCCIVKREKSLIREDKTEKKSYFDMISLKERWKIKYITTFQNKHKGMSLLVMHLNF